MLLFHLPPCHENVFYNHANVPIGSVGVKWLSLFLKYLQPWSPVFMRDPFVRIAIKRLIGKTFLY